MPRYTHHSPLPVDRHFRNRRSRTGIPPGSSQAGRPAIPFEDYTLENGLHVVLHEDHAHPVVALVVMYHVGSKNERPGRTGLAHLFEHLMFRGSRNVAAGQHIASLQEIGGSVNGSTTEDRTIYYEAIPRNATNLALFLEADRMGGLLAAVNRTSLENQREVVMNERRERYDNQPYGTAGERLRRALYRRGHPYSWPVIGSMRDLIAARLPDVKGFFRTYYVPNNACLVVAGDFDPRQTRASITQLFGGIPRGQDVRQPGVRNHPAVSNTRLLLEDRVQLPRLYLSWPSAPQFTRVDAVLDVATDIIGAGTASRLYKTLVVKQQIAHAVSAYQYGLELAGATSIEVTARPGVSLGRIERAVNDALDAILSNGVTRREVEASLNNQESRFIRRLTTVLGKAAGMASYATFTGDPGRFAEELDRFRGMNPEEIRTHARRVFGSPGVLLSVVPVGARALAAPRSSPLPRPKAGRKESA